MAVMKCVRCGALFDRHRPGTQHCWSCEAELLNKSKEQKRG